MEDIFDLLIIPTSTTLKPEEQVFYSSTITIRRKKLGPKTLRVLWNSGNHNLRAWHSNVGCWYPRLELCKGDLNKLQETLYYLYSNTFASYIYSVIISPGYKVEI